MAMAEPKRFQSKREPLRFFIDDDEFLAPPSLPAGMFMEFTRLKSQLRNSTVESAEQQWQEIIGIFEKILLPESFELFQRRIHDPYNPIDMPTVVDVIYWLFGEAYSNFPTPPPLHSLSTSKSENDGGNSTDGAQLAALTPSSSNGDDSST